MADPRDLTKEEKAALSSLRRLAKKWPESLWLYSASGSLCVMRCDAAGERVHLPTDGVDPDYCVETIDIPNDGGDW